VGYLALRLIPRCADFICDSFGYYPLPSVQEVLAKPSEKPLSITYIHHDLRLCVGVSIVALIELKPTMYNMEKWRELRAKIEPNFNIIIDGTRKGLLFTSQRETSPSGVCANIEGLPVGYHVARIEFNGPQEKYYQYTWVFEVTADDVVPEVTATAVP
jgi:hypothetical protein